VALILGLLTLAGARSAAADLALHIGPQSDPTVPDAQWPLSSAPAGRQFFDVVFDETGAPATEDVFAFTVVVRLVRPAGDAGGIRLSGAEAPPDHYLFENIGPYTDFGVYESDADHTSIAATGDALVFADITDGAKAARIYYTIDPAGLVHGDYRIRFEPGDTAFAPGRPGEPLSIPISLADEGVIRINPEPTAGMLLTAAAAALALLRPRRGGRSCVDRPRGER
jgi:hypothetical protein